LYGKEEEGKLFLILMYIKLPMYLKQCRMGGGRWGGEVRGKGRLFLIHSCSKNHDFIFDVQKRCIGNFMYMSKRKIFLSTPPPPILTIFDVWEEGFCYSCMDGKVRNRTG
jgi:hypothetical protein